MELSFSLHDIDFPEALFCYHMAAQGAWSLDVAHQAQQRQARWWTQVWSRYYRQDVEGYCDVGGEG